MAPCRDFIAGPGGIDYVQLAFCFMRWGGEGSAASAGPDSGFRVFRYHKRLRAQGFMQSSGFGADATDRVS